MNKVKAFLAETRAPFLTVTILPVILGCLLAVKGGAVFDAEVFAAAMAGFIFLHLGTNVMNDYFDFKNGTDNENKEFISPFTGGSRLIQSGALKPAEVFAEGAVFFLAGIACGIFLGIKTGSLTSWIWTFAVISGFFYTAPPFKWAHLGLGELLIFLNFGPVMVFSSYYVLAGKASLSPVLASLALGFLTAAIVDINQFPDYKADKTTGKKNLIVRLGREKGRIMHLMMVLSAYVALLAAVAVKALPAWCLLGMFSLILSVPANIILFRNFDNPKGLAPACGMTIMAHLLTGLLIIAGLFIP